ncbi:cell division protein ZapE [Nocardia panacis]|uniref:Cell division protein ZapE n=1 Tax=Nocardia panacis TaxID=2340916 RepID=A0A3A4KC20_9NOCA|nr:cell division protein ZapE [Nocardia panacis]RJO71250.1 cell division protein ZapE [Nocardia panacis]
MNGGDITFDTDQRAAADHLAALLDRRGRPLRGQRGVYLHGRPGRGKTLVLNRFYASINSDHKRRYHFHQFFAELHRTTHEFGALDTAIDKLLGAALVVCFDEFHVHDIGDAMLIARMLRALFARRITLVVTSNYPPEQLLPNPLFHDKFLPTIAAIRTHLDIRTVDGPTDYRTAEPHRIRAARGFTAGQYFVQPAPTAGYTTIRIGTHQLEARAPVDNYAAQAIHSDAHPLPMMAGTDELAMDFAALCGTPTSAADYVELARRFHRWTLRDIPPLAAVPPDWATRLVNLIDVLYDADRELTIYATLPPTELVDGVRGVPDLARTASRLGELPLAAPVAAK